MIDPITLQILQEQGVLEGYCLKCALCGRVVGIVKDGEGVMSCCNKRMFVMSGSPEPALEGVRKALKGQIVEPDFQVPIKNVDFTPDNQAEVQKQRSKQKVSEAEGMKGLPKGWKQSSLKKFSKSLTGKEGTKEGFFDKCVKRMTGKVDNPEGFCASVKDEMHGSTYWRGKDKSPQEAGKDVKQHKNVKRG
jgi:hypothetical protein